MLWHGYEGEAAGAGGGQCVLPTGRWGDRQLDGLHRQQCSVCSLSYSTRDSLPSTFDGFTSTVIFRLYYDRLARPITGLR